MNPIPFDQSNRTYVKPDSMTDEQCSSLPVFVGVDLNGFPLIISKWELTPEELEQINENYTVWLQVVSTEMPPVALFTQNPFENPEPKTEGSSKRQIMELNAVVGQWLVNDIKARYPFVVGLQCDDTGTWYVEYSFDNPENKFESIVDALDHFHEVNYAIENRM